jgi:hypothetical protein
VAAVQGLTWTGSGASLGMVATALLFHWISIVFLVVIVVVVLVLVTVTR